MAARLAARLQRAEHDLFLPLTFALARRLEQASWAEFAGDLGLAAFTLRAAQQLFGSDGLVNWFDCWLEAEAAGARVERDEAGQVFAGTPPAGPLPPAEEILKREPVKSALALAQRLSEQAGDRELVLGYLTGPTTLTHRLFTSAPDDAQRIQLHQLSLALAKAYCEAGVSALLLAEQDIAEPGLIDGAEPLFNLAEYYDTPVLWLAQQPVEAAVSAQLRRMGARIVAPDEPGDEVMARAPGDAAPLQDGRRRLVLSPWDLPAGTAPEDLTALAQALNPRP